MSVERSLVERLSDLPDLDVPHALHHLGGLTVVLDRTLRRVAAEYGGGVPGLVDGEPSDDGDADRRCARACHSLRGVLTLIGAMPLAAVAERLEHDALAGLPADARRARAAALDAEVRSLSERLSARL